MLLLVLQLVACTCQGPATDAPAAGELPPSWWWVTAPDVGFEATFPGVPLILDQSEALDLGSGVTQLPARRVQVVNGTSSFAVSIVDLPEGAVTAAGGAATLVERSIAARASALSGEVRDARAWSISGLGAGRQAALETGRPGESLLRMGLEGDDLWIVQALGDRPGTAERFVASFSRVQLTPTRVALGTTELACPGRCGTTSDRIKLVGGLEPLQGYRGVVGSDRFEGMALRVPAGVAPEAALEALEERAVRRSRGLVESESGERGRQIVIVAGSNRLWVRFVVHDGYAYALEVTGASGEMPDWGLAFLDSVAP